VVRRLKKLALAVLAVGLMIGNTDWGIGVILALVPGRYSPRQLFFLFVLIANLQTLVWYKMGPSLVVVLGDCYCSMFRWYQKSAGNGLVQWFLKQALLMLRPFRDWEVTKGNLRHLLEAFFRSKRGMATATFSWLILPGSRSLTAILFGMEEWPGAMFVLLAANTAHVALSFMFWAMIIVLGHWML